MPCYGVYISRYTITSRLQHHVEQPPNLLRSTSNDDWQFGRWEVPVPVNWLETFPCFSFNNPRRAPDHVYLSCLSIQHGRSLIFSGGIDKPGEWNGVAFGGFYLSRCTFWFNLLYVLGFYLRCGLIVLMVCARSLSETGYAGCDTGSIHHTSQTGGCMLFSLYSSQTFLTAIISATESKPWLSHSIGLGP